MVKYVIAYFSSLVWVIDFFILLEGDIVSARALRSFNFEELTTEINTRIEAMSEEGRLRGLEHFELPISENQCKL